MKSGNENWKPCEPGLIQELARDLRAESRGKIGRQRILGAVGSSIAVIVILVVFASGLLSPATPDRQPANYGVKGGLSCSKVVNIYDDYAAGKLDKELTARVSVHLDDCPHCRNRLEGKSREGSTRLDLPKCKGKRGTTVALSAIAPY